MRTISSCLRKQTNSLIPCESVRIHSRNGNSLEDIKKILEISFKKPISKSDKFLINDVMSSMCPEFDNRKIFEN